MKFYMNNGLAGCVEQRTLVCHRTLALAKSHVSLLEGWCDECRDADEPVAVACPECSGETVLLGVLGWVRHYRCRQCGMDVHQER